MADPTGIPVVDGIQAGVGLVDSALGLIRQGSLNKQATQLAANRPQYQISPLTGQDLSLAQSELANNSSSGEKAYNTLNNGQFSSSMGSILKGGGSPNEIGALYGSSQDGRLKLAEMSDNLRLQKISNYLNTSQNMQNAQQTQWQLNKYAPWENNMQAIQEARLGTSQQISQGINTFGSGVANAGQAIKENNAYNVPTFNSGSYTPTYNTAYANPVGNYATNNFASASNLTPMEIPTFSQ